MSVQIPASLWVAGAISFVALILGGTFLFSYALRRSLRHRQRKPLEEAGTLRPRSENPTAFMAASMQAVIQKLREQEKELAQLHRLEKERAQQTERLSEAVTRNMPAGLLLVNATGLITSANPAAETALGVRALAYRRYT
jgi:PAS domain-containing protein